LSDLISTGGSDKLHSHPEVKGPFGLIELERRIKGLISTGAEATGLTRTFSDGAQVADLAGLLDGTGSPEGTRFTGHRAGPAVCPRQDHRTLSSVL